MGFLKLIGAVSAAEHSKLDAKFKKAIKDLAAETEMRQKAQREIVDVRARNQRIAANSAELVAQNEALRPDAEKWRDRAARELQRGQAKRDAAAKAFAEATTGMGRK